MNIRVLERYLAQIIYYSVSLFIYLFIYFFSVSYFYGHFLIITCGLSF